MSSWRLSFLSVRRREYDEQYAPAADDLEGALAAVERHAFDLVASGLGREVAGRARTCDVERQVARALRQRTVRDYGRELAREAGVREVLEPPPGPVRSLDHAVRRAGSE